MTNVVSALWKSDGSGNLAAAVPGTDYGLKVAAPGSSSASGTVGTWAADSSYFYVCIATNTWKRVAISTW